MGARPKKQIFCPSGLSLASPLDPPGGGAGPYSSCIRWCLVGCKSVSRTFLESMDAAFGPVHFIWLVKGKVYEMKLFH